MKLCRSGQTLADSKGNERNKAGIVSCTYKFKQFTNCGTLRDCISLLESFNGIFYLSFIQLFSECRKTG